MFRTISFHVLSSIATSDIATAAVKRGACLITHLFNAMPQLHHRDPSIIGLLGLSPHLASPFTPIAANPFGSGPGTPKSLSRSSSLARTKSRGPISPTVAAVSEAFDDIETPPQSPMFRNKPEGLTRTESIPSLKLGAPQEFERPFYEMIVDGIHSHPNSVRVGISIIIGTFLR